MGQNQTENGEKFNQELADELESINTEDQQYRMMIGDIEARHGVETHAGRLQDRQERQGLGKREPLPSGEVDVLGAAGRRDHAQLVEPSHVAERADQDQTGLERMTVVELDQHACDGLVCDLEPELSERHEREGQGDAPWPPQYRKQPGEPPRVQPSRKRKEPASGDAGTKKRASAAGTATGRRVHSELIPVSMPV